MLLLIVDVLGSYRGSEVDQSVFCGFTQSYSEMPTYYVERFLSNPLQFIIH